MKPTKAYGSATLLNSKLLSKAYVLAIFNSMMPTIAKILATLFTNSVITGYYVSATLYTYMMRIEANILAVLFTNLMLTEAFILLFSNVMLPKDSMVAVVKPNEVHIPCALDEQA